MQTVVTAALIAFMAATAEAQAEATRETQKAGIAHAKAHEPHRYRGREPSFNREQLDVIRDMLAQDASPTAIAEASGCRGRWSTGCRTIPRRQRRCWRSGGCRAAELHQRQNLGWPRIELPSPELCPLP